MKPISFWRRLLDLISPRVCVMCGKRLAPTEEVICNKCYFHLPRTEFWLHPYDNVMAKAFWHLIPIERAAAFFYYESHAETANIIYQLKYKDHPEVGSAMGRMMAMEIKSAGFFDEIDGIVPIPLTKKRYRQRGYNQSEEIAKGVSEETGIPIYSDAVKRVLFAASQTKKGRWARTENVEKAFQFNRLPADVKHVLLIDDVVTTGSTVMACAKHLAQEANVKISVLSLGFTKR